jgi:Zn-dependent membrane protease YugP
MITFGLLLFIAPALLLGLLAQLWIRSSYAAADKVVTSVSGAAAARHILDANGLRHVAIEQTPGELSDHYDPRHKVLRLSQDIFHGRSLAAVGIAAHEAGHAIQDARNYAPLVIRNLAVPAASFGSNIALVLMFLGVAFSSMHFLLPVGIVVFAGFVFFQLVNLPVEYDASSRAKTQLVELGLVQRDELPYISRVLHAAALTYVAATLQAVLTIAYYALALGGRRT